MLRVYVSGPYTSDPVLGIERAIEAADELFRAGFCPFLPHLSHYWNVRYPHDWAEWMRYDDAWLSLCDALIWLPGPSIGVETEIESATRRGIPVFPWANGDAIRSLQWLSRQVQRRVLDAKNCPDDRPPISEVVQWVMPKIP